MVDLPLTLSRGTPEECVGRDTCVFNGGTFGFCMCYEHYKIRHGQDLDVIRAYFDKRPDRRGQIEMIQAGKALDG